MGQEHSRSASLAEKRYKVDRPKKRRRGASLNDSQQKVVPDERASLPIIEKSSKLSPEDCCPLDSSGQDGVPRRSASPRLSSDKTRHFLTRRERILLQHSWKKTRKTGAEHVGSKIFFMVLTAQPDIKAIFGLEKISQGRLKYDPRFRQHALVFTRTFDYVMQNIDYPEKLENHFESLGRKHVVMQGRGFNPQYWETFAECMTQAAVEWEASRQKLTISAWRTLVSTIIMYMRRGFDEDNAKRRSSQSRAAAAAAANVRRTSANPRPVAPVVGRLGA